LLWQKERLLNIAIERLPSNCELVAWLDCDVVFDDPQWHREVALLLRTFPIVQPYGKLLNLDSHGNPRPLGVQGGGPKEPIANPAVRASLPLDALEHEFRNVGAACGYAWAARSALLKRHGLYDACIVGSGDRAIFCGAAGLFPSASRYMRMNRRRYEHFMSWAKPLSADVSGRIGWASCTMRNLWHGSLANRKYEQRHIDFERFNFDPETDISLGSTGVWQWASAKPQMHRFLVDYFFSRNEDGGGDVPTGRYQGTSP
jgi:hypothetical protein